MSFYSRLAGSQLGSSALFGGAFFAAAVSTDGLLEAATVGALASASWFACVPLLRRVIGGLHGA